MSIVLQPIGTIRSTRKVVIDDEWGKETATIELDESKFTEEALFGLNDFSHVIVVFYLDKVDVNKIELKARHPRNNSNWPKVGIFAQRGKNRPNQIGITVCRVEEVNGTTLTVSGLDAIDNTPVLDIKPYMTEFGPNGKVRQPDWSKQLMKNYF
ncbi:tRNA (N6-threonylcarbamoyladenosine(37)-N6)-methyltransferase TrmO [Bacillus aquiflavi]|uniref:tRNA (N6-threonylcarbamoyladenosine(37)-N6)-methyltransferase TrmO n=1 Tax=Bacillus aquiflavi TaxID=2672567 RepID=A0A6B3W1H8_9BACI|nr:tRNA (N6-threonylcarbamoyladenosine(37)-N6)-methyltransferase TrmO [Bacillus aquiflavi]MBA4536941.1 tRNA (N6-threonylcarbamoyladenosine(37)-N6)-methyltransferase TrmO [Bacillus aquiflavi]NEY82327.1 tRNA (N6-threonylcarbamoyladenosine(37)-N6)-methyltransferase TrmO [Bacillus aquiflavi]